MGQTIGLVGLRSIGAAFTTNTSRNIYLEVSNTLFQNGVKENEMRDHQALTKAWENNQEIVAAWRAFGTDWILFGSDGDPQAKEQILNNPLLSQEEKYKILIHNGHRLLKTVVERTK